MMVAGMMETIVRHVKVAIGTLNPGMHQPRNACPCSVTVARKGAATTNVGFTQPVVLI